MSSCFSVSDSIVNDPVTLFPNSRAVRHSFNRMPLWFKLGMMLLPMHGTANSASAIVARQLVMQTSKAKRTIWGWQSWECSMRVYIGLHALHIGRWQPHCSCNDGLMVHDVVCVLWWLVKRCLACCKCICAAADCTEMPICACVCEWTPCFRSQCMQVR